MNRCSVRRVKQKMWSIVIVQCVLYSLIPKLDARYIMDDYQRNRTNILEKESFISLGGKVVLNKDEKNANNILMKLKEIEVDEYFRNPQLFNFSRHYFTYKDHIEKSKVYQIIKRMPKGAALHIHSTLMMGADYMLNLTYEDHLYACIAGDDLQLLFSDAIPQRPCTDKWALLSNLRNASVHVDVFDSKIKKHFTMHSKNGSVNDADINSVWKRFNKVYSAVKSLITYRPVREKFMYDSLKRFYDDNVMYVEVRSGLHNLYELNGTVHEKMYMPRLMDAVAKKFKKDYPDFIGLKLILTRSRAGNVTQVREALDVARQIKKELPHLFAGFDLVGQEDLGKPLMEFLPALLEAKDEMKFYFHGGETTWYGSPSDENLIDAILLGSKRIGHAYALNKHPALIKLVKEKGIALEVNVISNAVLSLVRDVRNHPLATFLALGLPVVLSSDDPGVWGAEPLSHDFYVAFIAVASQHADLRLLKKLALNSIKYSALSREENQVFVNSFTKKWNAFIKEVNSLNTDSASTETRSEYDYY